MMLQGKGREKWLCVHVGGQKTAAEECLSISIVMNGSWGWEQWFWVAAARLWHMELWHRVQKLQKWHTAQTLSQCARGWHLHTSEAHSRSQIR